VSTAIQVDPVVQHYDARALPVERVGRDGKFLRVADERDPVKGVTYGTFAFNTVRTYTAPRRDCRMKPPPRTPGHGRPAVGRSMSPSSTTTQAEFTIRREY
jgi:hypothetical protein